MFRKTRHFRPLSIETLLFGKSGLSFNDNFLSFQAKQQNVKTRADLHVDFYVPFGEVNWDRICAKMSFLAVLADILFHLFCFVLASLYVFTYFILMIYRGRSGGAMALGNLPV